LIVPYNSNTFHWHSKEIELELSTTIGKGVLTVSRIAVTIGLINNNKIQKMDKKRKNQNQPTFDLFLLCRCIEKTTNHQLLVESCNNSSVFVVIYSLLRLKGFND
jgi:hypothetical protein